MTLRFARTLVAVCAGSLAFGCGLERPAAPTFETRIFIPLGEERTTGRDLMERSEFLGGDTTGVGTLAILMEGTIEDFEVGDMLDVEVPPSEFTSSLESIEIDDPAETRVEYPFSDLWDAFPDDGADAIVPAFVFSGERAEMDPLDSFDWVLLEEGRLRVRLDNLLPVAVGMPEAQALRIRLVDRVDLRLVREIVIEAPIPPGTTADVEADLAGAYFHNLLDVEIAGMSPGSGGESVPLSPDQVLAVRVSFEQLLADSAVAKIPPQRTSRAQSVAIAEDMSIERGQLIDDSRLPVVLRNALPLESTVLLSFPHLSREGTPISAEFPLPAASLAGPGEARVIIDLSGAEIVAPAGELLRDIEYSMDVEAAGTGERMVAVGRRQLVRGTFEPGLLRFEWVTGDLDRRVIALTPSESAFEPPEGVDSLYFEAAMLAVRIESSVAFDSEARVSLEGLPEGAAVGTVLLLEFPIRPGTSAAPTVSGIQADETNSRILDLLHARPRTLAIGGEIVVGGQGRVGTIHRTDAIRGSWSLTAPMRVRMGEVRHKGDPFLLTLSRDHQERLRETIISGQLTGIAENHFPAELHIAAVFGDDQDSLDAKPAVVLRPVSIASGEVEPGSGRVARARESRFSIPIDPDDVGFFARGEVSGRLVVTLRGRDRDEVVELTANDYIALRPMLEFRVRVKEGGK